MSPQNADLWREAAERRLQEAETQVEEAVLSAVSRWLEAVRFLILRDAADLIAVGQAERALDVVPAADDVWLQALNEEVLPALDRVYRAEVALTADATVIRESFGEEFRAEQRANPGSTFRAESAYMQNVHDRFKIWPEGAFEEVRPELVEALSEAESMEQITDRVGRTLGIDKDAQAIKGRINEVETKLKDDDLDPAVRKALRKERGQLWREFDAEETKWRWKARRIARTETHGAMNAGQMDQARRRMEKTGQPLFKRWLGTKDGRTRDSHRIADGQIVRLDEKFMVGGYDLDFPGDPEGPGREVIHCRCSLRIEDDVTLQEQLQGPDGSLGDVRPGGVRLGPDSPASVVQAMRQVESPPPVSALGKAMAGDVNAEFQVGDYLSRPLVKAVNEPAEYRVFPQQYTLSDGTLRGEFFNTDNRPVGSTTHEVSVNRSGALTVHVRDLSVDADYRGQGIAGMSTAQLEDFYRRSGVEAVTVTADHSHGGIVWARLGYGWDRTPHLFTQSMKNLTSRIDRLAQANPEASGKLAVLREQLWDEAAGQPHASAPSPFDISKLSATGLPDMGVQVLQGVTWHGRKPL